MVGKREVIRFIGQAARWRRFFRCSLATSNFRSRSAWISCWCPPSLSFSAMLADGAAQTDGVMVYGRRLYVRTSILNAKSRQPKAGLQVDGRAVDPNCMDPGL